MTNYAIQDVYCCAAYPKWVQILELLFNKIIYKTNIICTGGLHGLK